MTTETTESDMLGWSIHMHRFGQSILRRRQKAVDHLEFAIKCICNIALESVVGGVVRGGFLRDMQANSSIPSFHVEADAEYEDPEGTVGWETMACFLHAEHSVTKSWHELGCLAHEFWDDKTFLNIPGDDQVDVGVERDKRVQLIRDALAEPWNFLEARRMHYGASAFSEKPLYAYVFMYLQSCLLYSYSAMWPSQWHLLNQSKAAQIQHTASLVMSVVDLLGPDMLYRRMAVFPVFNAGILSKQRDEKLRALAFIKEVESESFFPGVKKARKTLEEVLLAQSYRQVHTGQYQDVDWMPLMNACRLAPISFSL
jgi:hypothetical protein